MSPSIQGTVEGEGGDQSSNKIQPFPGYRDSATVDREENDGEWSEVTYDSEEEKHNRNVWFSFLGLILCCGLIVASIIILFMVSTQDMLSTPQEATFRLTPNKFLTGEKYSKSFSQGLLKEGEILYYDFVI